MCRAAPLLVPALALALACSSAPAGNPSGGGGSGGAATGSGGDGSGGAGAGGGAGPADAGSGGAGVGGAAGAGGAGGAAGTGSGGAAGTGAGGAIAADGGATGPFTCNQMLGVLLTSEWYLAGFETGVDNARWQIKWQEHGYIDEWANSQSTFWNARVDSPCAAGTASPDRVVLTVISWTITTEAVWESNITAAVNNLRAKYPNLRRVDLLTVIRGPNNTACGAPAAGETIVMPPEEDAAISAVALKFPGFVFVGPKFEGPSCAAFSGGGPHLTAAGNMAVARTVSAYFSNNQ